MGFGVVGIAQIETVEKLLVLLHTLLGTTFQLIYCQHSVGNRICSPRIDTGAYIIVIVWHTLVFLSLTEALAQLGPSLPAGLKIATFDDYPWNHVLFGGVTTAAQDTLTIAERVVDRLSERIDVVTTTVGDAAKLAPKRIEVPGHIEHRASTSR